MTQSFFVLHELRLGNPDLATRLLAAAQLAGMTPADDEQVLPMLVSLDDRRDVACVRRVRALPGVGDDAGERIQGALHPKPESSGPPRYYSERALAGDRALNSYFRMAVTESGTNDEANTGAELPAPPRSVPLPRPREAAEAGLLWIGTPVSSEAGLLVVTGHHDASAYGEADRGGWPLPTSRELGVRIYESARP